MRLHHFPLFMHYKHELLFSLSSAFVMTFFVSRSWECSVIKSCRVAEIIAGVNVLMENSYHYAKLSFAAKHDIINFTKNFSRCGQSKNIEAIFIVSFNF